MYINKISIKKFRHLENESLGPFKSNNKNSDLITLAGPNGSGKSSVLELIGYALSNSYSLGWNLSRTFSDFSFEVGIGLSPNEIKILLESLNKELGTEEENLRKRIEEFKEVGGLSEVQIAQETQKLKIEQQRKSKHKYDIVEYLTNNNVYYRAFNYNDGEYAKGSTLHNQIHSYVTQELKNVLKRSLGFFLRSDRYYPKKGFNQQKIFSYSNINRIEHLWTVAFNTSEIQYQDMYEFLVQQKYHYLRELGNYYNRKKKGAIC